MERRNRTAQRLLALFAAGWLLLTYPLLQLLGGGGLIFGLPAAYTYLFCVWLGFIALLALLVRP